MLSLLLKRRFAWPLVALTTLALGFVGGERMALASTFIPDMDEVESATAPRTEQRARPTTGERRSEGRFCATCAENEHKPIEPKLPFKRFKGLSESSKYHSAQEACLSQAIFEGAQRNQKRRYNRSYSKGACAVGVRGHLGAAGVYSGEALAEEAISYNSRELLKGLGFENFASEYKHPREIPKGAVVIFAGPKSHEFIRSGKKIYSGSCRRIRKGKNKGRMKCSGAGNWAGHITVAGESRGAHDRWWYTDGREPQPAEGWPQSTTRRRIVGVWLMQKCTDQCSPALRARCGG